jgi:hypothetical protein
MCLREHTSAANGRKHRVKEEIKLVVSRSIAPSAHVLRRKGDPKKGLIVQGRHGRYRLRSFWTCVRRVGVIA